jgi:O-acetyl-ADP-ribose deacetylase (regulator of RNase III)
MRVRIGKVRVTKGYNLPAKWVCHTPGPIWNPQEQFRLENALRDCYHACIDVALAYGWTSIAFPAISTGIYGFPIDRATEIVMDCLSVYGDLLDDTLDVVLTCFDEDYEAIYQRAAYDYEIVYETQSPYSG